MPTYRKKPVLLQAFRLGTNPLPDWFMEAVKNGSIRVYPENTGYPYVNTMTHLAIDTRTGTVRAKRGDWVIQGSDGEIYPSKNEEFVSAHDLWFKEEA